MEGRLLQLGRPVPPETQRLVLLFAGLLTVFGSISGGALDLFATDLVRYPVALGVVAAIGCALGITMLTLHLTHASLLQRHFTLIAYTLQLATPALISAAQYSIGPRTILPFLLYVEVTIFSFYLMPTVVAYAVIAMIGVELGVVLIIQPGYPSPVAQWAFLLGTVIAVGATFGGLLARALVEVGRFNRLRRFLPDQVATALLDSGSEEMLAPHRREIAVLFCDLRGFTRFASDAAPEEVVDLLGEYYRTVAEPLQEARATVGALAGDGLMAYFNDPVPCPDPAATAVRVALVMRDDLGRLREEWEHKGFHLGVGIGIAYGYATLGTIGLESRGDYTALGPVVNLASRLCDEAQHGEILIDQRAYAATRRVVECETSRLVELKGYSESVTAHVVSGLTRDHADDQSPLVELAPQQSA
ncbi:MAG: adenylate/guanylate cyclase domain-containing protein [Candidatus Dormibacteria bacterium]